MMIDRWSLRRLCRARELLAESDASITDIAAEVQISPYHFIRQFDALFGATPHQFRTQQRIERAKQLLSRGHSVTDTCMELGFSSVGSFSALFTRHVGTPPSVHRRLVQVQLAPPSCLALMAIAFRNFQEARSR